MAKSREGKDSEYHLGIIRKQKAEIRNLKKRIRRLEKDVMLGDYISDDEDVEPVEIKARCPECSKTSITQLVLVGRSFNICESCGYRSKATKL